MLWDAQSGQAIRGPYQGDASTFPVFLPDGSALLVGRSWYYDVGWSETRIDLWDYEQGEFAPVFESPTIESDGLMADLAISPDGKLLAAVLANPLDEIGAKYSQVIVWELVTGSQRCAFLGDKTIAFDPTGEIVAVIYNRDL